MPDPLVLSVPPYETGFQNIDITADQITTNTEGKYLEPGEEFHCEDLQFGYLADHITRHIDGVTPGSQFNKKFVRDVRDVETLIVKGLPPVCHYDQFRKAEFNLTIDSEVPIGWTGLKTIEEIKTHYPDARIEQMPRIGGGVEDVEEGIKGAWYPQIDRRPDGVYETAMNPDGTVKNPRGKFEPDANIAFLAEEGYNEVAQTNIMTVIVKKERATGKPYVVSAFPGECAPPFPVKIKNDNFEINTLHDPGLKDFWDKRAFIRAQRPE